MHSTTKHPTQEEAQVEFDDTDSKYASYLARCDQCEAAMINGVYCHEIGCPKNGQNWRKSERWFNSPADEEPSC